MGKLYLCGTPIGNLEDITLRSLRILKEVDLIAAEDTRHTKKILDRYNIKTHLTSYHKFNIKQKTGYLLQLIKTGKSVALVTDSGMPGISDPGYELVREAVGVHVEIIPIPGPSAGITALSVSGLPTDRFVFEGFLPRKKGRLKTLEKLSKEERTIILYESPYRIIRTLKDIKAHFGERQIVIGREITKVFEEFIRGRVSEVISHFEKVKPRGEFTIVVEGFKRT